MGSVVRMQFLYFGLGEEGSFPLDLSSLHVRSFIERLTFGWG